MADISVITLPDGSSYDVKDATARAAIAALGTPIHFLGVTTTELTDGSTTNPITVGGASVTAGSGDFTVYGNKEFLFDGTAWHEFGDMTGLGDLAYKSSATGSYTPAGTINAQNVSLSPTTESVTGIDSVGTLPTMTVSGETLVLTQGTLPTKQAAVSAVTGMTGSVDAATFTGTAATITVS